MQTLCRLPLENLALHAGAVLRMLWDSDLSVRGTAVSQAMRMLKVLTAPALKEQLRHAALDACTGGGALGTLR
jgi:hypothetical protein